MACCWFEQTNNKQPFRLKAFQTKKIENLELEQLIVFNPSLIGRFIKQFLNINKIKNPFTHFCLNGPSIIEQFVPVETATPTPDQFHLKKNKNCIWDYTFLYPTYNGQFIFYASGIKREKLFQYQLLAMKNKLNLISITTATMALLNLYHYSKGKHFRHSQLGIELEQNNQKIEHVIPTSIIDDIVYIDPSINVNIKTDASSLLCALGLFITRNKNYG